MITDKTKMDFGLPSSANIIAVITSDGNGSVSIKGGMKPQHMSILLLELARSLVSGLKVTEPMIQLVEEPKNGA